MGKAGGTRQFLRRVLHPSVSDCMTVWALLGLCFAVPLLSPISDPDVWWHLQTGKIIATTHSIPTSDVYSYSIHGKPWFVHEWLSLLLAWLVYAKSGLGGLLIMKSALILATFTVILRTAQLRTTSRNAALSAAVIAALVSMVGWGPRPQLFGYLCLALLIWLIHRFRQGASLWPTAPLFALWINLHASWAVGLAVLLATGIEPAWQAFRSGKWPVFWRFAKPLPLTIAALFLSPRPIAYVTWPFHYLGLTSGTQHIAEWQKYVSEWHSPDFHQLGFMFFGLALLSLPVLLHFTRTRSHPVELALVVGFGGMGLYSLRHVAIFAIVIAPLMAGCLGSLRERTDNPSAVQRPESPILNWLVIFALPALIFMRLAYSSPFAYQDMRRFPVRSFDYLQSRAQGGRILSHYNYGGYAIFRLWPKYRLFVDGRADVYDGDVVKTMKALDSLAPSWRRELRKANPDVIVWPKDKPLAQALELLPEWRRVRLHPDDKVAAVFVPASESQPPTR